MILGTASAATQIEGGALNHSWMDWYRKGHIADDTSPARANDHYTRWREDDALMRDMGMQIARIGVEWARIEPEEGVYDEAAIAHYVAEVDMLLAYGIKPLVTLHHFTNPMWFENIGAFEKVDNIRYFIRFAERMVAAFGPRVTEYITINEPNVYATNGYFFGIWPPGKTSLRRALHVMSVLAAAHIRAYRRIHAIQAEMGISGTRVSYANHMRVFAPQNPHSPLHRLSAWGTEWLFQGALSKAMGVGRFLPPLRNLTGEKRGLYCDFIALNYYTRSTVSGPGDGTRRGAPVNDLGWEIYPQGIVECARKLYKIHPLPVYVTENGTCDNTDGFRCRYLYEHIRALCESDLPVERYYHWCFIDNFEWAAGETPRFGLVHVDYDSQARTVKQSGRFFSEIIQNRGVTEAMYQACVAPQQYKLNT
jgi:beta-glucosidase